MKRIIKIKCKDLKKSVNSALRTKVEGASKSDSPEIPAEFHTELKVSKF